MIAIAIILVATIWLYNDNNSLKSENSRLTENNGQLLTSKNQASLVLNKQELKDYLEIRDSLLLHRLSKEGVKLSKVEKLTTVNHYFKDTTNKSFDVSAIIGAINKKEPLTVEWKDTVKCLSVSGNANFDGQRLIVNVTDREYKNKTDAVWYADRKEWRFWFIKSKFLGKRIVSGKIFDECGESKIIEIQKSNN